MRKVINSTSFNKIALKLTKRAEDRFIVDIFSDSQFYIYEFKSLAEALQFYHSEQQILGDK